MKNMWMAAAAAALAALTTPGITLPATGGISDLAAQSAQARASLTGEVVDAESGAPLVDALVTLRAAADSVPGAPAAAPREMKTLTDAAGRYRFEGLPPGSYEVEVERLGFRRARIRVEIRRSVESRVSVGLQLEPIALEPMTVASPAPEPYGRDMAADLAGAGQAAAAELRQRRYLASDAWSLTHADLLGAVTMGESDLFRALQRLPGVSTRDEWTAELWTRGADWDHTRVYFDGLPLFNPVHGGGVLSGVNSDAVGAVYLHPGVRPARIGEGASALELRSRSAGGEGDVRGFGELSLASARLAVDRRIAGGRGGWMVAGRRTYLDWFTRGIEKTLAPGEPVHVPYQFTDLTTRVDYPLGDDASLEVSALWEVDRLTGDVPDVIHGTRLVWGNLGLQATVETPLRGLRARHTVGYTGYAVDVDSIPVGPAGERYSAPGAGEMDHRVRYGVVRGELAPAAPGAAWSVGYELVRQSARAVGETPPMYLEYHTTAEAELHREDALTVLGAWAERRWTAGPLEAEAGLRTEAGSAVANGGALRLSPRLLARLRPASGATVTAAVGRSYQYTQMLTPIGFFRADFPSGHLWMLAGEEVPALRSDIGSVGGEVWLGSAWLASTTAYLRRSTGVVIPDPRPGVTLGRPLFVSAEESGRGVELALRRLKGRVTGSLAYTLASAGYDVDGLSFPTRADRRRLLDATALVRVTDGLRLGGAYSYLSGSPFTRVTHLDFDEETGRAVGVLGRPNAARLAPYASLDLMAEWMKSFRGWRLGAYLQVRNALNRKNSANYVGTHAYCADGDYSYGDGAVTCSDGSPAVQLDEFLFAMPRLPLFGFRLEF